MKNWICVFIFLGLTAAFLAGQTDFETWKAEQEQKFNEFKSAEEEAFLSFLEQEWQRFQAFKGIEFDTVPKFDEAPVSDKKGESKSPASADSETEDPVESGDLVLEPLSADSFSFFGKKLSLPDLEVPSRARTVSYSSIADFWRKLDAADFSELADYLRTAASEINLGDWGTGVLAFTVAGQYYPDDKNSQRMLAWFVMVRIGYDVRVGYSGQNVFLLIPSLKTMYSLTYYTIDSKNFYIHDFIGNPNVNYSLYIYDQPYSGSESQITFHENQVPKLANEIISRDLFFNYASREYSISLDYNKNLVAYYNTFPQTSGEVYFRHDLSAELLRSIEDQFSSLLSGMGEFDQVNFLLRFVQTAFEYQTDQEQFGYEKWMFPEEALYHRYIDCEDRSILYSSLVKNLLGMKVIGLDWPGHIAVAVQFAGNSSGTFFWSNGSKYYVCDPTYINADAGEIMPEFNGVSATIIGTE